MLVTTFQVRNTTFVPVDRKLSQLRHRHLKSFVNSTQSRIERLLRRLGQLFEEVTSAWRVSTRKDTIGLACQLRNYMHVSELGDELSDLAELLVRIDLHQMSLR